MGGWVGGWVDETIAGEQEEKGKERKGKASTTKEERTTHPLTHLYS